MRLYTGQINLSQNRQLDLKNLRLFFSVLSFLDPLTF